VDEISTAITIDVEDKFPTPEVRPDEFEVTYKWFLS